MITVRPYQVSDQRLWYQYVENHLHATLYHLSIWKNIIEKTYGHKTYYLIAEQQPSNPNNPVVGILPLVHMKHPFFGNNLISIPFWDYGGVLADDKQTEKALLCEAMKLGKNLKVGYIELRHTQPLSCLRELNPPNPTNSTNPTTYVTRSHKVRMLYELPESSEMLMNSYKSKLRSQIKKPLKEGLYPKVGGIELLEDFYKVFSINMRDLGSPVHSSKLMKNVLTEFSEKAKIVMVYKDKQPLAASLIIGFKNTLENPWASALREYSRLSPNMLLYWSMLEYACDNGYKYFDFGRSTPDEGTYKFKKQWGAKPNPLYWHYISLNGQPIEKEIPEKFKFEKAIHFWKKLPVPVTKTIGPMIRKHIGL